MFLPISDSPNPPGTPYVNYLFIGLNVAVFLFVSLPLTNAPVNPGDPLLIDYLKVMGVRNAMQARIAIDQLSAYDLFVFRHGYRPGAPSVQTLFSSLFLHGGWMHLLGNMLFLWIFGDNVEHRLGRLCYVLFYLGAGVAATLFFAIFVPGSLVPLVGASGAISGVLGCYFLWFPRNRVRTFVFLFPILMTTLFIPARWVLGFYLMVDNLLPFLVNRGGGGGVAHGAHIGGFIAGFALAYAVDRVPPMLRQRQGWGEEEALPEEGPPDRAATGEKIAGLLRAGNPQQAAALYQRYLSSDRRRTLTSPDLLAIGDFFLSRADYDRALGIFRRFIAQRPGDALLEHAYLGAGKALIHKPRCITSAYHYFLAAIDVARSEELAEEARLHLRAIERLGSREKRG